MKFIRKAPSEVKIMLGVPEESIQTNNDDLLNKDTVTKRCKEKNIQYINNNNTLINN